MYPTDLNAQRLHKAFHAASNQASGAEKLFAHLQAHGLPASLYATARAYCNSLVSASEVAACAYQSRPASDAPYAVSYVAEAA
jgi:hypothetical protein